MRPVDKPVRTQLRRGRTALVRLTRYHAPMAGEALMHWCQIESPVGPLLLAGDAQGLRIVHFQGGTAPRQVPVDWIADPTPFARVRAQLAEYFAGQRRRFEL